MTTVSIETDEQLVGKPRYRAIAGKRQSTGRTAGEALDSLNKQHGGDVESALILVQRIGSDPYFSEDQYHRMKELLARQATLSPAEPMYSQTLAAISVTRRR